MKISQEQAAARVTKYMQEKLLPSAQNPLNKFKIGFAMPIVQPMVAHYWKVGEDLGLVCGDGTLDTDRLAACVESGMAQAGDIVIQGFRFNADDAKVFMRCLNS